MSSVSVFLRVALIILALLLASSLRADDVWTLTSSDFTSQPIHLRAFNDQSLSYATGGDTPATTLPIPQFLRLDREARATTASAAQTLFLVTGDRIRGQLTGIADDKVSWTSSSLGELKLSIDVVRAISREATPTALDEDRKDDQVVLSNKDVVRGVVAGMADGKVSVQVGGDTSVMPMASVVTLFFASPLKPAPSTRAFRLRFADGSVFTSASAVIQDGKLQLSVAGAMRSVDLAAVTGIEQVNGPIAWLSSLKPTANEQVSFLTETPLPARMDRNVFGKPMRYGSQIFERGIGVHANSKLVFALDGSYKTFRTRFAIDTTHAADIANVRVRILLDDKVVHEEKSFRADHISAVLAFPLGDAKTLTLEVTANETIDAQDRLNWIDAALLRK